MTQKFSAAQSATLHELGESLSRFGRTSAFRGLGDAYRDVASHFRKVEADFPEVAAAATAYHEKKGTEFAPHPPTAMDSLAEQDVFTLLLILHDFYDAEGFNRVTDAYNASLYAFGDVSEYMTD